MEYPLIIDGVERGKLRVEQEGLYTVFEAELADVNEGLYRIWIHGGGEHGYLGLMQPWSGGMYLRRKLSRSELKDFPPKPEYASNENVADLHNTNCKPVHNAENKENRIKDLHNTKETEPHAEAAAEDAGELLWFRSPDGSLVSFDGKSHLVALPVKLRAAVPNAVLRRIEGREYMIFRY